MTLTELRYVVTLARERHFGRAAERCHVSQPTLSVAVKKLEDELGIPLFERSKSSIRVTETGLRIIEQAQRVLDQVGLIKDMAQDGKNQLNSPLKVGAIYTIGPYLFPHLLPELRRAAPEMPLYIEENYTANLRQKLRQSELDAIIIALPFEEPEVVTLPLYDEPFVVVAARGTSAGQQGAVDCRRVGQGAIAIARARTLFPGSGSGILPTPGRSRNPPGKQRFTGAGDRRQFSGNHSPYGRFRPGHHSFTTLGGHRHAVPRGHSGRSTVCVPGAVPHSGSGLAGYVPAAQGY